MANTIDFILTNAAQELISKVLSGKTLNFTRMAIGDGFSYDTTAAKNYTALVNEVLSIDITKKETLSASNVKITSAFKNTDAQKEFYYREVGLYAQDPDTGLEILYAYGNRNDAAEFITPSGSNVVTKQLAFIISVGDSAKVTFNVNAGVYALQEDVTTLQANLRELNSTKANDVETKQAIAVEQARINNLAKLQQGSTTGDAELQDGRIDIYGHKQANLGENVRNVYRIWKTGISNVIFDNWEIGNINGGDGSSMDNTARLRTGYVSFEWSKLVTFIPLNGFKFFVFAYDSNYAYKGVIINGSMNQEVFTPTIGYFYRILLYNLSNSTATLLDADNLKINASVNSEIIDGVKIELNTKINEDVLNLKQTIMEGESNVTFKDWEQGNIVDSTGVDATATDKIRTGYHQFKDGETVSFGIENPFYLFVYKYNSNKVFESMLFNTVNKGSFIADGKCYYRFKIWSGATLDPTFASKLSLTVTETPNNIAKLNNEVKILKGDAALNVPDEYFIIKGKPLELFKYGMFFTKNPYVENEYIVRVNDIYDYTVVYSDRFIITIPTDFSNSTLNASIALYDKNNNVLERKSVVFRVVDASLLKASNASKTVAFFGDSLTAQMILTDEVVNLLRNTYGLTNTKLVGKYTSTNNSYSKYTANGGYAWDNYLYNPATLPAECPNNWLWSSTSNDISFKEFMNNYGDGATLDYVVCLLGWNDFESGVWASNYSIENLEAKIRLFISKLHAQYPNTKVLLVGYHSSYPYYSLSHGNNLPYTRNKFIYDLTNLYNKLSKEMSYVKTCHVSSHFDVFHNLIFTTRNANNRCKTQVTYCQDNVHPADIGYYQYADAIVPALCYLMQ